MQFSFAIFASSYLVLCLYETDESFHDQSYDDSSHLLIHAIFERYYRIISALVILLVFAYYFHRQEPNFQVAWVNEKIQ